VSPNSRFIVTSGHDKSLRLWERSEEVLVLDDERETEREKEGDAQLATGDGSRAIPGEADDKEAALPAKKTVESEKGAERLMEAIELYESYKAEVAEAAEETVATGRLVPAPPLPPLMMAYRAKIPEDYMAKMVELVKSSEVEQTLLVLPYDVSIRLLRIMETLLERNKSVEVVCRMFFFFIEINYGILSSGASSRDLQLLQRVKKIAHKRMTELRDCVGFNQAALRYHQNRLTEDEKVYELMEASTRVKDKRRKKKNKAKAMQTAILTL
jgi:U3 small nucleolar RNA-associated protein 12